MDYFRDTGSNLHELRHRVRDLSRPNSLEVMIARAVERGQLPDRPGRPAWSACRSTRCGTEILMTMRPVPDDVITGMVDDVWLPLLTRP